MKYILIILALLFMAIQMQAQDVWETINKWKSEPLTTSNVAQAIIDLQIENPVIVFKQTIKESGWKNFKTEYKSKLALIGNNLFGMRKARKRMTTALDKQYCGYATYSHWIYSVLDYKYWQDSKPKKKHESYKKYLVRRGYARNTKGYVKNFKQYKLPENIAEILNNETEHNRYDFNNVAKGQLPFVPSISIFNNAFRVDISIELCYMERSGCIVRCIRQSRSSLFAEARQRFTGSRKGICRSVPKYSDNFSGNFISYARINRL